MGKCSPMSPADQWGLLTETLRSRSLRREAGPTSPPGIPQSPGAAGSKFRHHSRSGRPDGPRPQTAGFATVGTGARVSY